MSTSRRTFLKSSAIATAGIALDPLPGIPAATASVPGETPAGKTRQLQESGEFTRGIGLYPGDPAEDFSPQLAIDSTHYRNLALLRPAYHSSSYDYNLTAQLVTDGIKDTRRPDWIAVSVSEFGPLSKARRELSLNHSRMSPVELFGEKPWIQFQLGGESLPEIDRIDIVVVPPIPNSANLSFAVSTSDDGRAWTKAGRVLSPSAASVEGYPRDFVRPGQLFIPSIALERACRSRFYRVDFALANAPEQARYMRWAVGEVEFYRNHQRVQLGGPYRFTSAWMSAGPGEEWVYVDLGAPCTFDRIKLYWIARAAEGKIQASDDAERWRDLHRFHDESGSVDDVKLPTAAHGRYLRVLMTRPTTPAGYILSEMEVFGRGGPAPRRKPSHGKLELTNVNGLFDLAASPWRLQRESLANGSGADFSRPGFRDHDWLLATVPGTVLASYLNAGAVPDPNYGPNQLYISDSYFHSDFWYRTEFTAPDLLAAKRVWLNLDAINWKANLFLNGVELGRIEGAFMRGKFDVSANIRPGATNALAVRIQKNETPGSCKQKLWEDGGPNGGALGSDNPTYHASVGWDWIPTIRGRNTGIIGSVYFTQSGAVTIEDPFVTTSLPRPDTSSADVVIELDLANHGASPVQGTLRGRFGEATFDQAVTVEASAIQHIKLDPASTPALRLPHPRLWWPNGYGDAYLYDIELAFETDDVQVSDTKKFKAGVRQVTYNEDGGALRIWINGRRFIARGGNWGFSESMLRFRKREYDAALRYHREMNFNMIRNWVGQVGDNAFYDACDRHGVMIWQDFWLANPWDGPEPDDNELFLKNAKDTVRRIRNHPSVALYCGRNEGHPPKPLDDGLRALLSDLHPGIHYISNSAEGVVGGGGPYMLMPLTYYSEKAAFEKLHSEIGIPNIPSLESVRATLSTKGLWPPGEEWGLHDLSEGAFGQGPTFFNTLENAYGRTENLEEWVTLAHLLDYDGFRAEFEAQSKNRMGLLLWMSHCCWPSLLWQCYDYFMEPTAAYFACKSVCEPLHIQWDRVSDEVQVVNYNAGSLRGLTAQAELLNLDGSMKWQKAAAVDSVEDSSVTAFQMEYPVALSEVHFVRLTLSHNNSPVSRNLYLRGLQEGDYRAIRQLAKARVTTSTHTARTGRVWQLTTRLQNTSSFPALLVRLKVVRDQSGDRIVPVIYEDNYFALMPGEQRTVKTEVNHADTRGENPRMVVGGFNVVAI